MFGPASRPGASPARPWRVFGVWLFALAVMVGVGRGAVVLPQECGDGTSEQWRRAASAAVGWFAANQHPDGTFLYEYDATSATASPAYNWVRHAGVLLSLEQAAAAGITEAEPLAALARTRVQAEITIVPDTGADSKDTADIDGGGAGGDGGTRAALRDNGQPSAGGTALLVAALGERREARGATDDDALMRALGRYLLDQVEPDGRVDELSDPVTLAATRGTPSIFTTSEVAFALARLERLFPGEGFGGPVRRITHYVATARATDAHVVPDIGDHWMAYALAEVVRWSDAAAARLTAEEVAWGRKQMGIVAVMTRFESQRTGSAWSRWLRGKPSMGSALGTHGESLNGWAMIVAHEPSLHMQQTNVVESARCNAGLIAERQVSVAAASALHPADPAKVEGAWLAQGITRMDDQQHTLSALVLALDRAAPGSAALDPAAPQAGTPANGGGVLPRRAPVPASPWLMALVAFVALNPVRLGVAAARGAKVGRAVGPVGVALGGAVALAVLCVVGLAGERLWRTLDVSIPVGMIAAALAVIVGGLLAVFRPFPRTDGVHVGWHGVVLPVLIPLALRPELVALALAASAAGRTAPFVCGVVAAVGGGVVLAAAFATVCTRATPDGNASPPRNAGLGTVLAAWFARLVAVATVVGGVALLIDAVYAV